MSSLLVKVKVLVINSSNRQSSDSVHLHLVVGQNTGIISVCFKGIVRSKSTMHALLFIHVCCFGLRGGVLEISTDGAGGSVHLLMDEMSAD